MKEFQLFQIDPSRLVTCASGWKDHPVGHVVDVHTYPGPVHNLFPEASKVYSHRYKHVISNS